MAKQKKKEIYLEGADESKDFFKKSVDRICLRLDRIEDEIDLLITVLARREKRKE
jgi:nanoRNase/pAp phosphatase (c-di-AMP/oligoRNAs hydrolase)